MGSKEEHRAILERCDLFATLDDADLDDLVSIGHRRKVAKGEVIFVRGEPGRHLFAVISGQMRAVATAVDGRELVLRLIDPGEIFGELALLDGGGRTTTVDAVRAGEVLVIERRAFIELLRSRPQIAIELLAEVAGRLRSTTEQASDTHFLNLAPRLAKKLAELAAEYGEVSGTGTSIRISQEELGNLIATTRVSVNTQLKVWEREGLVSLSRGQVTLLDRDAIQALAGAG